MTRDLLSKQTRQAFRDAFSDHFVLRTIRDVFDAADVEWAELPAVKDVSGQRRMLVEEYYSTVDWADRRSVDRIIAAFETALIELDERAEQAFGASNGEWENSTVRKLLRLLRRDGYLYENSRIVPENAAAFTLVVDDHEQHFDGVVLREHLRRIEDGIERDPALAIGSAKELLESVSRMVLKHYDEPTEAKRESLPQLVKRALACLDLSAESIPESAKAADASKMVLGSLGGIVQGMAEIRNLFGTGHGRAQSSGIQRRHAMLMVGASSTLCQFMMATYEDRVNRGL